MLIWKTSFIIQFLHAILISLNRSIFNVDFCIFNLVYTFTTSRLNSDSTTKPNPIRIYLILCYLEAKLWVHNFCIQLICLLGICYFQEILEGVTDVDLVINLKLREEALLAKCLGRRICSECGGSYNVACVDIKGDDGSPELYMAPLLPPPHCATKLITRSDDTEEVVKERLRVYNEMVILHLLRMSFANV